jgi:hypothetical protein
MYREKKRSGPDHDPRFTYEVLFGDKVLGEGSGKSIQQATAMADTLWAAGPESQIRGPVSRSLVRPCQRMHKVQEKYKNPRRTGKKLSANRNFTGDTQHI